MESGFEILHNSKIAVKIGKNGIHKKIISPEAIIRAEQAIEEHYQSIQQFSVTETYAFATSAIRGAENGKRFVDQIRTLFNIDIQIISGDEEATLIYYGVKQAVSLGPEKSLILDIGGGSNEFIIANKEKIFWKGSFELGIARLIEIIKPHDPILFSEIKAIEQYSEKLLGSLTGAVKKYKPKRLIGAAGSFETFIEMIEAGQPGISLSVAKSKIIALNKFFELHEKLIVSTEEERRNMKGLDPMRIEMIVPASVFVNFILRKYQLKELVYSDFSLKEGVLYKLNLENELRNG